MASISKATPPKPVASWASLGPQDARITLSGRISADSLGLIWQQIRTQQNEWLASHSKVKALVLDGSQIEYLDGAGLAFMIDLCHAQEAASASIKLEGFKPSYQTQLKRFTPFEKMFPKAYSGSTDSFIIRTGKAASIFWNDIKSIIFFTGQVASELVWAIQNPLKVRWQDFASVAVQAGLAALPIVGLVAFLIGVILSFQSAIGMEKFGAITFVGPLVSLGIFRELGPLITAILLAGRSSAAFAAEIGTMTVNSEVDALVTAGLSPIRFLVLPRVLAGIVVAPILTIFADLVSVFSSSLTMLIYGIPLVNFYEGLVNTVKLEDIFSGLIKATLFGVVIASVGCLRGMQTGTGAAAVGISTTRAVVSSIVMITVVDGIFAYVSYRTGF
jgi:phospholipid/cholesterol/gamma-HCH transport system permease protein